MPASGPSKDELREYWANNRQYFDELARYYMESDKDYYNKNIAPFYSNPFHSTTPSTGGARPGRIIFIVAVLICVISAGAVAFFVMMQGGSDSGNDNNTVTPRVTADTVKDPEMEKIVSPDTTAKIVKTNSRYYEKAQKYYHDKKYDEAEKYFNLIGKNDVNYMNAQKSLFEIKLIRSGDKGD